MISENLQKPTDRADHILRAQRLFAMIAPVYDLMLARSMTRVYRMAVDLLLQTALHASGSTRMPPVPSTAQPSPTQPMPPAPTALDVGTGTGLFASELARSGFQVTAIDSCRAMLQVARRRRPRAADYIEAEAHLASRQPGAPFDIVCTGMLLHGLPREYRVEVLVDMIQAARNAVVMVDYFPPPNLIAAAVERLEGSYYRGFLHEFGDDLAGATANTLVHPLTATCALYLVPLSPRPDSH